MSHLSVRDVSTADRRFDGITFDISKGAVAVLFSNPQRDGSAFLRLLAGLDHLPLEGEVSLGGLRVNDLPPSSRYIGMVFGADALYPSMSVRENLAFALEAAKMAKLEIESRIRDVALRTLTSSVLDDAVEKLGVATRQRAALARALARHPRLLLLDDPFREVPDEQAAGLQSDFMNVFKGLPNLTTLLATTDVATAQAMADVVILMQDGRITEYGSPQEMYDRPATVDIAQHFSFDGINLFPVKVVQSGLMSAVQTEKGLRIATTTPTREVGLDLLAGIRPEDLMPVDEGEAAIEGRITALSGSGGTLLLTIEQGEGSAHARLPNTPGLREGDLIRLAAPPDRVHLFDRRGRNLIQDELVHPSESDAALSGNSEPKQR